MVQLVSLILIQWIGIYLVDSAIQLLNNWGQVDSTIQPWNNRGKCVRNSRKNNLKVVFYLLEMFVYIQLVTWTHLSSNAKFSNAQFKPAPLVSFICPFHRRKIVKGLGYIIPQEFFGGNFKKSQEHQKKLTNLRT